MCNVDGERAVADALHAALVGVEILDQAQTLRRAQERLLAYVLAYGDNNTIEEAECLLDDGFVASGEGVERPGEDSSFHIGLNILKFLRYAFADDCHIGSAIDVRHSRYALPRELQHLVGRS